MADRAADSSRSSTRSLGRGRGRSRSKSVSKPGGAAAADGSDGSSSGSSGADSAIASDASKSVAASTLDSRPPPPPQPRVTSGTGRGKSVAKSSIAQSEVRPGGATSIRSDVSTVSKSSAESVELAKRPGFGQSGRQIQLRANCFTVNIKSDLQVFQYRIDITQADGYSRKVNREDGFAIFWQAIKDNKLVDDPYTVLYDGGGSCFTLIPMKLQQAEPGKAVRIEVDWSSPKFGRKAYVMSVGLSGVKKISFTSGDHKATLLATTVLDLVFRQLYNFPTDKPALFHPNGRSFFNRPSPNDRSCFELDSGREVWSGYYYAAALGVEFVPILNIDVANGIFLKDESVLQYMCDVLNGLAGATRYRMDQLEALKEPYYLKPMEIGALSKALKGYYIMAQTAPHRHQKVVMVTEQSAETLTFELRNRDGSGTRRVEVAKYYREHHGIPLRHPYFPCIQVGTKTKFGYLPLEVCKIVTPQRVRGKLTDTQTSTMIKGVCTDAIERENRINNMIRKAGLHTDPFARNFGVNLSTQMMQVKGRVLGAPQLEYAAGYKANPRDGSWNLANQTKLFFPAPITSYGLISFMGKNSEGELVAFCDSLMRQADQMGMKVDSLMPSSVFYVRDHKQVRAAIDGVLAECADKGKKCDIILVPSIGKNTEAYAAVKSYAEKEFGVATQFVLQKTIRKSNPQTLSNIVFKMNVKLGGINWKMVADIVTKKYLISQDTLVIGLDVTHPGPTDAKTPSIGAAVGNIDVIPGKFGANVVVQKHRREDVLYLVDCIRDRINHFFKQVGKRPERIIIYRDGVAEGQFAQVLKEEMKGVRLGFEAIGEPSYEPMVTYIVVQKRHHVRFFCADTRDQCGRAKNVPPGTAVDSVITDPQLFDFYLCSHFGIQGTSRPTHYHVLRDDSQFTPDELQSLTYQLCHIYSRCTRSVSIPAPCYYAHLACERARYHLAHLIGDDSDDGKMSDTSSTKSGEDTSEEQMKKAVIVCENMLTNMYFC